MKTYEVVNPYLVFSVKDGEKPPKEYALKKGDKAQLPENDIAVRALLARKQIKEVPDTMDSETATQDISTIAASATGKPGTKKSSK